MFDDVIYITNDEGVEEEFNILLTFHNDEYEKDYVVYFRPDEDELFVSSFIADENEGGSLNNVEDDAEWDMIEEVITAFIEEEEEATNA